MRVMGRKKSSLKADKARWEEIESINAEIDEIQQMLEEESIRFRLELQQISTDNSSLAEGLLAEFEDELDKIDENGDSQLVKEAEYALSLADFDSKAMSTVVDSLDRISIARYRHLEKEAQLIERRTACFARWRELLTLHE